MSLNLEGKKDIVQEVAKVAANAKSAVAAEYRSMTVKEMTQLRTEARKADVYLRVIRNTLARRAIENSEFACMQDSLVGPLVLAFSREDPSAAPRVLGDFAKTNKKLIIKVGAFGGKLLQVTDLQKLASMPTRPQAISMLMGVMLAPVSKLARTLAAVRDAKDTPPEPEPEIAEAA